MGLALACLVALAAPARALESQLTIGGAAIQVHVGAGERRLTDAQLLGWVEGAARAVSAYFGRFPVKTLDLTIGVDDRRGVHGGVTRGWPAPNIHIKISHECPPEVLARDWVLVHEMVHTSFPNVDRDKHAWAEEGLSTYVEPWARVRAGQLTREHVWADLAHDMPQGDPEPGDQGLDHTPTWGRTYWGGAQFWMLADVELREKSGGRLGLEDALRAIQAAGGDVTVDWPLEQSLAVADKALGLAVLVPLHDRMKAAPAPVDLPDLWKRLGIKVDGERATFDDAAPLAAVRRQIERGPAR